MAGKFLKRYVILALILMLCAGAAWYFSRGSAGPYEDAVLASAGNAVMQRTEGAERWTDSASEQPTADILSQRTEKEAGI